MRDNISTVDDYEIVEEHELPEECQADYVTIREWSDGDLTACPFVIREEGVFARPDRTWYDEPDEDEWSPSEEYREAIDRLSEYDVEEITVERHFAEPQGYWDHNKEEVVQP